jgi:hypothetical protein
MKASKLLKKKLVPFYEQNEQNYAKKINILALKSIFEETFKKLQTKHKKRMEQMQEGQQQIILPHSLKKLVSFEN